MGIDGVCGWLRGEVGNLPLGQGLGFVGWLREGLCVRWGYGERLETFPSDEEPEFLRASERCNHLL
jgi:hypothetical protein